MLVSSSFPFAAHLGGWRLRRVVPRARWLVDIGDPFSVGAETGAVDRPWYRGLDRRAEAGVLRACDAISVVTAGTARLLSRELSIPLSRFSVIPHLAPSVIPARREAPEGPIRLGYFGVLHQRIRRPDFLLDLVERMTRVARTPVELHLWGSVWRCEEAFRSVQHLMGRAVFLHVAIPHERMIAEMHRMTALVNLGSTLSYALASKLPQYAALHKPILHLGTRADDPCASFLESYPDRLLLTAPDGRATPDHADRVLAFLRAPRSADDRSAFEAFLRPHRIGEISGRYLALLTGEAAAAPARAPVLKIARP